MREQKKEELGKLYALRTRLLTISQMCNTVDKNDKHSRYEKELREKSEKKASCNIEKRYFDFVFIISLTILVGSLIFAVKLSPSIYNLSFVSVITLIVSLILSKKYKRKYIELEREIKILTLEIEEGTNQIDAARSIESKDGLLRFNAKYQEIANTLQLEYGSVLDRCDWENIDRVIFYFETGRANTVKEALQLVKNERIGISSKRK